MSNVRGLLLLVLVSFATGCFHWAPASSLDDVDRACRVRVVTDDHAPVVLERPSVREVYALVSNAEHARIEVRKVNAWATALIATGGFVLTVFTAFALLLASAARVGSG